MLAKSIRSKFLLWLAFMLVALLVGFGITAWELFRTNQDRQLYEQLQRRLSAIAGDLSSDERDRPPGRFNNRDRHQPRENMPPESRDLACATTNDCEFNPAAATRAAEPPDRGPHIHLRDRFDDFTPPREPEVLNSPGPDPTAPSIKLSRETLDLFDDSDPNAFYFAIWSRLGTERLRSTNAPNDLPLVSPVARAGGPQVRTHGENLESYLQHALGYRILVGHSIAPELATRRTFTLWLISAGLVILAVGLCGGWWLAGRALRPVQNISAAASRISAGNLSERIDLAETDNELGQLATTLNSTFSRLEAAFTQQKQFTADASHELRTPLAVIIAEAQTTLARPRTEAEYRETVEACLVTAQQMRQLTESLLELARYDSGQENIHHTPFDIADLTNDATRLLETLASERQVRIETNLPTAPTAGDADRIRQVIINLISNAIYYNKPGVGSALL